MRAGARQRVSGYARTSDLRLCTHQILYFGRKSRELTGICREFACVSGHVPSSMSGIAVRPPPSARGNVFFSPRAKREANNIGRLWG